MSRRVPTLNNSPACQRVLRALRGGPLTPRQISDKAHVSFGSLTKGRYLRTLETAGRIHVARWQAPAVSGAWAPVWQLGAGPSAPRPARQSNTDTARRWRHKRGNAQAIIRRESGRILAAAARPATSASAPVLSLAWLAGMRT